MNHGFTYTEIIGLPSEGRTVLAHLTDRYPHSSQALWRERLEQGLVRLGGLRASPEDLLKRGQTLAWVRPPWTEPEVPLVYALLHRDEDLLAVAKPAGLPTMPAGGYLENTLMARVKRDYPEATPLHRLGRGTSGIVLFARTPSARSRLLADWRGRRIGKIYRALVQGHPAQDRFAVTAPIGPIDHPVVGRVFGATPGGKASRSLVRVLERRSDCSLVEVAIETGRPHQIRIHLAFCGHPLVGDPQYRAGGGLRSGECRPGDEGYHLHAESLILVHPRTGEPLSLHCQPPPILRLKG